MTPPDPSYTDPIAAFTAPFAAVKPVFYVAGIVAASVLFGSSLLDRIENIESDVQTIKMILCEDKAADSYCKGAR